MISRFRQYAIHRSFQFEPRLYVNLSLFYVIRDFAFFVFERTKHQPRRHLLSYLVLQRLCSEAALSPGIDAFWYQILV